MKPGFRNRGRTAHIAFDTAKCKACWKCLKACQKKVIGRVNLPFHRHALIQNSQNCTGCLRCTEACRFGAIVKI